jgi:hypothetical protein
MLPHVDKGGSSMMDEGRDWSGGCLLKHVPLRLALPFATRGNTLQVVVTLFAA